MTVLRYIVPPEADGQRLGIFLRTQGVTAALIKSVKYNGDGFFADGAPLHTDQPVHPGQQITFALPPEPPTSVTPQPVPFAIAYEDEFAAVLEKPGRYRCTSHVELPGRHPGQRLAVPFTAARQDRRVPPVNRIDKNTSGLVLCAQNSFAAPLLADSAQKCYLAIVQGILPLGPGQVEAPIARRGDSIIGRCVREDGKYSLTRYNVLGVGTGHSLVACTPCTGRTHQIRVHMAYIGHPLAGDTLYGGSDSILSRHALHCAVLRFTHPSAAGDPYPERTAAGYGRFGPQ